MGFKKILGKIIKVIVSVLLIYMLYILVFFVFVFKTTKVVEASYEYNKNDILTTANQNLYATLIETPKEAMDVRLKLIEQTKETIYLTYYFYQDDKAAAIFTEALLRQADLGKKIYLVIDGKTPIKKDNYALLTNHPNVYYYLFEPLSLLEPYALNNVMHDKLLLIDKKYGLIGGRNISNRFLLEEDGIEANDRDVLIFSDEEITNPVKEMAIYFNELIEAKYTKLRKPKRVKNLIKLREKTMKLYDEYYLSIIDLTYFTGDNKIQIDNATFLRSPIGRMVKEPIVAKTVFSLYEEDQKMTILSPYITSSKIMRKFFPNKGENKNITLVTNSIYDNPNFFASTGYYPIKERLAKNYNLYEYQGEGSIHGKTIVMGDNISVVGSLNIDTRSFFLSTESVVVIISEEFNEKLTNSINLFIDQSLQVKNKKEYYENDLIKQVEKPKIRYFLIRFVSSIQKLYDQLLTNSI